MFQSVFLGPRRLVIEFATLLRFFEIIIIELTMKQMKEVNLDKRNERAQFAFAAVTSLIKAIGGNAFDAEMAANWERIVGPEYAKDLEVSGLSKPDKDGRRILSLRVLVPAKITVLAYEGEEIRRRVNKHYGREVVKKVSFKK